MKITAALVFTILASSAIAQPVAPPAVPPLSPQLGSMPWVCSQISSAEITPGNGYVPGVFDNEKLSGGAGRASSAKITVDASGAVSSVIFIKFGEGYRVGDVLTAGIKGGSGFSVKVIEISDFHPALILLKDSPTQLKAQLSSNDNDCRK